METNNFFCFKRASLLLKRTLYLSKKSYIIWMCIYLGMILLINLLSINNNNFDSTGLLISSVIFMFMYGMNFTTGMNKAIHKPSRAFSYLTLPVSNFERLLVTWLVSSLIFAVLNALLIYFSIVLSAYLYYLRTDVTVNYVDILDVLKLSLYYMVFQTAYLFGSIFFKKAQFLKTSLSLIVLFTLIIISMILLYKYTIHDFWHGEISSGQHFDLAYPGIFRMQFISIITYYITPILLLIATYFRIKEKEI